MELKDLKAGDEVVRITRYLDPEVYKIERVTKTTIVLEPNKGLSHHPVFNRETGNARGLGKWDVDYIVIPTEELVENINLFRLRRLIQRVLRDVLKLNDLDKEECYAIYRLLQPLIDKRNTKENSNA